MKPRYYFILIIAVLGLILLRVFDRGEQRQDDGSFTVIRVVDGDTVELDGRGTVRFLFIDTPEKGEMYYDSAKIFLQETILGKRVSVVPGSRARDSYGRLLGFIYLDTVLINLELVNRGFAGLYLYPENMDNQLLVERFIEAQRLSIDNNRGIWSLPHVEEEFYIGNVHSLRFHRPDCTSIRRMKSDNSVRFDSRTEALYQGYSPCRNCKP
ncbi:MAG: thermonuclease family protein [Candidatus Zixiibacteriota bacterium]